MTLNVAQIRMQQRTFEEVEKLSSAVQEQRENDDGTLSEAALDQVIEAFPSPQSGCTLICLTDIRIHIVTRV